MTNAVADNKLKPVQKEDSQLDLGELIPLGMKLIENNQKQTQAQTELKKEELEYEKEQRKVDKSTFTHKFWLLFFRGRSKFCVSLMDG